MNILEILQGHMTPEVLGALGQQTGATPQQAAQASDSIFSTILGGLAKNATTPQGAEGILGALDRDHDGSILNDVMGLLTGGGQVAQASSLNGAGILGHILGGQQSGAMDMIAKATGMDQSAVGSLMIKLAPLVMGVLGKQHQQAGGLGTAGLGAMLGGAVQTQQSNPMMQMAMNFLDKNGDGSIMDDIMGMATGGGNAAGGAAGMLGMLGNLFGKK